MGTQNWKPSTRDHQTLTLQSTREREHKHSDFSVWR